MIAFSAPDLRSAQNRRETCTRRRPATTPDTRLGGDPFLPRLFRRARPYLASSLGLAWAWRPRGVAELGKSPPRPSHGSALSPLERSTACPASLQVLHP